MTDHDEIKSKARQAGHDDALFDGIDTFNLLPCQCAECAAAYEEGQEKAMKEIFTGAA